MKILKDITLVIALLYLPFTTLAQEVSEQEIVIGKSYKIHSEILNEERQYSIYLPPSYDSKNYLPKDYPVLYLIDGEMHFQSVSGMVHHMSTGINLNHQIPELIIVAVHNVGGLHERRRDLTPTNVPGVFSETGGGIAFFRFIEEELMPLVEAKYRTKNYRILAGHSLGGLMAVHSFWNKSSPYNAFIAIDPSLWWDNLKLFLEIKNEASTFPDSHKALYLSTANNGANSISQVQMAKELVDTLQAQHHFEKARFKFEYFDEENHQAVPLISMYQGLKFIFAGYNEGYTVFQGNLESIEKHYEIFSKKVGIDFLPPEDIVISNARSFIRRHPEKAIDLLKMNIKNYPGSVQSYLNLANTYRISGDTANAIRNLKELLEIAPKSLSAKRQLEKLTLKTKHD